MANYFLYAYQLETGSNPLASLLDELRREWVANLTPAHTSLDDLEHQYIGVGIDNYGWYQARFEERVAEVYRTQGFAFVSRVREIFPAKETRRMPVADVLARLETISPGWKTWAESLAGRQQQ
jgi:hypothetical protein